MEKKCLNGASMFTKMTGENSFRAPILRMEDVLEMDAIGISERKVQEPAAIPAPQISDDNIDVVDSLSLQCPNSSGKKRGKRKLVFTEPGPGGRGEYDSCPSEEDTSEVEGKDGERREFHGQWESELEYVRGKLVSSERIKFVDEKVEPFTSDGRRFQSKPRKKFKRQRCTTCNLEKKVQAKRSVLAQSSSLYKSCDSDISNNESTGNKYYKSTLEVKTKRKTVDQKICNCYSRDYYSIATLKKRSSHDVLESIRFRCVCRKQNSRIAHSGQKLFLAIFFSFFLFSKLSIFPICA